MIPTTMVVAMFKRIVSEAIAPLALMRVMTVGIDRKRQKGFQKRNPRSVIKVISTNF